MSFSDRYGSWGIIAGASEGVGAEYADQLAARGLNLVLVARRMELLKTLAARLASQYGIRTKCLELDLADLNADEQIVRQTMDLDIGLLVYNATYSALGPFLLTISFQTLLRLRRASNLAMRRQHVPLHHVHRRQHRGGLELLRGAVGSADP